MQIILRYNFRAVVADTNTRDHVKVEGFSCNFPLAGFIDKRRIPYGAESVLLPANAWRVNFMENWRYLRGRQKICGALVNDEFNPHVYVVTDQWLPLIIS